MAKRNNAKLLKISLWVIGVVFAAGGVYTAVHFRLGAVESDVKKLEAEVESCDDRETETRVELVGVKKDIEHLGEKVDRNFTVQQQILTEVRELHR